MGHFYFLTTFLHKPSSSSLCSQVCSATAEQGGRIRRDRPQARVPRKQKIPRKSKIPRKIPRKQNAKIATGRLTAEMKIGPRMIDMIDRSATHARTVEAAARQQRQSYDDG